MPMTSAAATTSLVKQLTAAGMRPAAAAAAGQLAEQARVALGRKPTHAWWIPGRIEVLGKHTDYAGGRSLVCPTDLGLVLVAAPRDDGRITISSAGETVEFPFTPELQPQASWQLYPTTVARRVARNFPSARRGADLALAANLPSGAGMSSSSALVVAVFTALAALNGIAETAEYRAAITTPEDLAGYLGCVENGQTFKSLVGDAGVGTFGGSEDHTAIVCGRAGHLSGFRFCPVSAESSAPLPSDVCFLIAVSGVVAEKTAAAKERYNRCALLARDARDAWNKATGRHDATLFAALTHGPEARTRVLDTMKKARHGAALAERAEQFAVEALDIIPAAVTALARGDRSQFGALVARSQDLAERQLHNQVPETSALVALATEHGALAASAFGAGFGGAVWALVPAAQAGAIADTWLTAYQRAFPQHRDAARVHAVAPGPSVTALAV